MERVFGLGGGAVAVAVASCYLLKGRVVTQRGA